MSERRQYTVSLIFAKKNKKRLHQQREILTDSIEVFSAQCAALLPHLCPPCVYLFVLMSLCLCVFRARGSVLDVNDETPTFNPRVYNVSLKESVPRDHTVARLSCSDNDAGLNAELSYFITGQSSQCGDVHVLCLLFTPISLKNEVRVCLSFLDSVWFF